MGIQALAASFSSNLEKVTPYAKEAIPVIRDTVSKIGLRHLLQINLVYQLFDSGLANFLALDTNRQGVSLPSYLMIQVKGGSIKGCQQDFSSVTQMTNVLANTTNKSISKAYQLLPDNILDLDSNIIKAVFFIFGTFQPTVKYRFIPSDFAKQEKQYIYSDFESESKKSNPNAIGISHLGISGSLIQGLNPSLIGRIYNKPGKFALGCAQLIAAIALTCIYCGIVTGVPLVDKSLNAISAFKNTHYIVAKIAYCALHITTW